jgi:thioredoxin 1
MVKEIQSLEEFEREIAGPGLVVVDFFTTWCGPCKQVAPFIEGLAAKYPEVKFIKVDIEKNEDIAAPRRISSIPTFHFIVKGNLVDELKGANPQALEQKVMQHKVDTNPFKGSGNRLSDSSADPNVPALSAREARLKAFGIHEGEKRPSPAPAVKHTSNPSGGAAEYDDEEEALAKALALSLADGKPASTVAESKKAASSVPAAAPVRSAAQQKQDDADFAAAAAEFDASQPDAAVEHFQEAPGQQWEEEMVPVPVNVEMLEQMVEMGIPDVRARKALVHGGSVDGAMAWLADHQDDADIDQPYMVRKSDTLPKPPLSEEEKAARMQVQYGAGTAMYCSCDVRAMRCAAPFVLPLVLH